ncbi:4-coumarate-CoA ligase [Tothia fuscella]|uniref:4-coumarate-CoA ligase n=1 Tax=Tothia fuscella TaxID=1048955 RepID=A0A9P4NPQ1_9PEZI|nr:4-coumarate-CoA ligase [Tothia fuscella]
MPYSSPWAPLDIARCNILTYLFPPGTVPSNDPVWIDARNPSNSLSPLRALSWIKRFAVGLDNIGVTEHQAVMVFTPNHLFVPIVYLATAGSKRYFTGANPAYTVNEVAYQMRTIQAAIVLIHPSLLETGMAAARQANIPIDRLYIFSDKKHPTTYGVLDWQSLLYSEIDAEHWHWDPLEGDAAVQTIAAINFSSGTTGLPKGVCITHANLIANSAQAISNQFEGTEYTADNPDPEKWLAFLPLYHAYFQLFTINIACKLRILVYIMPRFTFDDYLRYIQRFMITRLHLLPPVLVMMMKRPETARYNLSSLKHILSAAAPLSSEVQNRATDQLRVVVSQGWGMTEPTCAGFIMPGMAKDMTGSIGYLLPNTEALLVDDGEKEVVQAGELWVRGPQIMREYWKNPQATQDSLTSDGWFKTGDVAVTRDSKWWVVDRKKELIKVNGLQVAPAELKAVLLEHNDVADAAIVGITVHGEELPRAYIVLVDGAEVEKSAEIVQGFMAARVAKHKQLAGGIKFVSQIPMSASGKIVRKTLREWAKRDARRVEDKVKLRV